MKFRKGKKRGWERNIHVRSVEVKNRGVPEWYLSKKNWRTSQTTRRTVVRWYALMLHPAHEIRCFSKFSFANNNNMWKIYRL